jgi:hypothetical protein
LTPKHAKNLEKPSAECRSHPNEKKVTKVVLKADAFLVYKTKKAVYHVHWESVVNVAAKADDPRGDRQKEIAPTNKIQNIVLDEKIPNYLSEGKFFVGYNMATKGEKILITNTPIKQ